MADVCQTCLSSGRNLFPLKNLQTLLLTVGLYKIAKKGGVCWECKSILVNFHKFKEKVRRAQNAISLKNENLNCLSNLRIDKTFLLDINSQHNEIEVQKFDYDNEPVTVKEEEIRNFDNEENNKDFLNPYIAPLNPMLLEVFAPDNNLNLMAEKVLDDTSNVNTDVDIYEENSCNINETYLSVKSSSVKGYFTVEMKKTGSIERFKSFEMKNEQVLRDEECLPCDNLLFKCNTCHVDFNTEEDYDNHMTHIHQVHKDSERHVCKLCEAIFASKELASEHLMSHHNIANISVLSSNQSQSGLAASEGSVKFDCRLCNKSFRTNEKLEGHLKIEHSNQCNGCRQIFPDYNSMRKHKESCVDSYQNACHICGKKFLYEIVLLKHVIQHKQKTLHKCSECVKVFKTKNALSNHVKTHTDKREELKNELYGKYIRVVKSSKHEPVAQINNQISPNNSLVMSRLRNALLSTAKCRQIPAPISPTPVRMQPLSPVIEIDADTSYITIEKEDKSMERTDNFECNGCRQTFSNKESFTKHKINHATENQNYQCDECGREFKSILSLSSHIKTHSTKVDKDAYCAECDTQFKSKMIYREHMEQSLKHITKEQWKFKCDECGNRFRTASTVKKHIQAVHRNEYNYRCDLCPMEFKLNHLLNRHMRQKHGDKEEIRNKICDYCGKAFKEKNTLLEHINIHLGIRPFECKECGMSYSHSGSLYTHMQVKHSNNRPQGSTARKRNPRRKYKIETKFANPIVCNICGKICKAKSILEQHMNIHLGLRPYKCKLCDAAFSHTGSLHTHNNSVHLKIKVIRNRTAEREKSRQKKKTAANLVSPSDDTPLDEQLPNNIT